MGALITLIYAPFCMKSLKGNPFFLREEDFLGFFPKPFPGAITTAALATATVIIIAATIAATATSGTPIKVKVLPSGETFQKVSSSISL